MSDGPPSWIEINAYVDGELDARRAAAVAEAAAVDPEVAAQVAALQRLKAVAGHAVEQTPLTLPEPPPRRFGRRHGIAACLAFLVLGAGLLLAERMTGSADATWAARAWAGHEAWLAAGDGPHAEAEPSLVLATLAGLGPQAQVPQLDAAKLRLEHVAVLPGGAEGGELLHLGYLGTRGCRLSLFVFAADGDWPEALAAPGAGAGLGVGWRVSDLGYLLLARGMDPGRFELIAETVTEATRRQAPLDAAARSALRRSRDASPPCRA